MEYQHKLVTALDELVKTYGGQVSDPMGKILWLSIKGQVPSMLSSLDNNPEAIAGLEAKMKEILETDKLPEELTKELDTAVKRHKNGTITIKLPEETWRKVLPQYFLDYFSKIKIPAEMTAAKLELSPLNDND